MKNRRIIIITALFLIIAIGNYISIADEGDIRAIEFLSIFVIGVFSGVLLTQLFAIFNQKNTPKY